MISSRTHRRGGRLPHPWEGGPASAAVLLVVQLLGCEGRSDIGTAQPLFYGGDPSAAPALIRSYGCGTCHSIPGIRGADGMVGPPLTDFGHRAYIAGNLSNTPGNLVTWIMHPQAIEPGTAMPDLGVSQEHARDIAAYLHTLR